MRIIYDDIWNHTDVTIGVPTNGYIKKNGEGVMGAGVAKDSKIKFPGIARKLGEHLLSYGNRVGVINSLPKILAIPVKPQYVVLYTEEQRSLVLPRMRSKYKLGDVVPGFLCMASKTLITASLFQLSRYCNITGETVVIPKLGCGNGGLSYKDDLVPILDKMSLSDNIILCMEKVRGY